MKKIFLFLATIGASGAHAQTFSYANDFSITNGNPNGAWSYGYTGTLGGAFTAHTTSETISDHLIWRTNLEASGLPANFKNNGAVTGTGGLAAGAAAIHPGPGAGEFGGARFTSPGLVGTVSITGSFGEGDFGLVSVYILKNGATLFSALNATSTEAFSLTTALGAMDTIDFVIGSAGIINGDTTPLDANLVVTPVPEPATLAALGLGLVAIRRRRK